jgi:hypothetical protein
VLSYADLVHGCCEFNVGKNQAFHDFGSYCIIMQYIGWFGIGFKRDMNTQIDWRGVIRHERQSTKSRLFKGKIWGLSFETGRSSIK